MIKECDIGAERSQTLLIGIRLRLITRPIPGPFALVLDLQPFFLLSHPKEGIVLIHGLAVSGALSRRLLISNAHCH